MPLQIVRQNLPSGIFAKFPISSVNQFRFSPYSAFPFLILVLRESTVTHIASCNSNQVRRNRYRLREHCEFCNRLMELCAHLVVRIGNSVFANDFTVMRWAVRRWGCADCGKEDREYRCNFSTIFLGGWLAKSILLRYSCVQS